MKHFAKRLLAAALCLCLTVSALPVPALAEADASAMQETIHISTADDLLQLAQNCRLDSWSRNRTVLLDADIDLTGVDFEGIPSFGGDLEGQNHIISGLSLTGSGSVQGLFRYIQQGAVVRDLHVSGTVSPAGTRATVGGIAGQNAGTIENCSFDGTVTGTTQIGGIAGINTVTGILTGCSVSGSVYGSHFIGGAAGQNDGVISACTNDAGINTTVSQNEVNLEDLTLEDLLKTERAADITDIGGIAGNSAGVIRACVNRGTVGYQHIGYNVGGIAGSQTGYIEGCVNYGEINARKEGGGIVGQMEPSGILQYNQDTLQQLRGELNTLQGLMDKATADASASSSELTSQLADLQNRVTSARNAVDTLLEQVADGIDIGTQNITLTDLTKLTGSGTATGGVGSGVAGGRSASTDVDVDITPESTPTPEPEPAPEPAPVPEAPAASETTDAPTPEATPVPETTPQPESPAGDSAAGTDDAGAESTPLPHGRPRRNAPSLDVDVDQSIQAGAGAGVGGSVSHDGSLTIDGDLTLTVPSIELNNRDAITAARSSLNGSLTSIVDGVGALNTDTGNHTQALIQDIQAITDQINKIGNTLLGAAENTGDNPLFEDVSDSDTDGDTEGKVFNCTNAGPVNADINAGGIAGAMARENDLDPEDDTRISGSSSLNATYKSRIVLRSCSNTGTVTVKKQCAGGIVGSMDMGTVMQCTNFADLSEDTADYVGGIAGQSKSAIRQSSAKCRLDGRRYVGGIAGSGSTLTNCRSMVLADGEEWVGAIAGGLESGNSLAGLLQDSESEQSGNYFVSETLGGIDGVSYVGQAEPLSFDDFAALAVEENLPETFSTVTLTFVADGAVVQSIPVEYGSSFDTASLPDIPAKDGCTARWGDFDAGHIVFDETVNAVYTPFVSVIESAEQRNGRAVLLAEGSFGEGTLSLTQSDAAPAALPVTESWQFALPSGATGEVHLHYLPADANTDIYLRDADGSWRKADVTGDGSYLVFAIRDGEDTLAAVARPTLPLSLLVGGGAAALLLLVLAIRAGRRRRHRHAERQAGPEEAAARRPAGTAPSEEK